MTNKPATKRDEAAVPAPTPTPAPAPPSKKKLSLDISDVSEVLERKISP